MIRDREMTQPAAMGLLFAIVASSLATSAGAQQPEVLVRTGLAEGEGKVWVGGRVNLQLDLLSAAGWANILSPPSLRVPGAIVYTPGSQSLRLNETIGGEAHTGQRYEYWIYPQRSGKVSVPSIEFDATVKVFGANGGDQAVPVRTEALSFTAEEPPDTDLDLPLITASEFEVTQEWNPSTDSATVGDGITRVVKMKASGVPGIVLPPLAQRDVAALRLYPKQPALDDSINRGSLTGTRSDAVTAVFQGEGRFELPELRYQWWNPDTQSLRTITLPGLTTDVKPATGTAGNAQGDQANVAARQPDRKVMAMVTAIGVAIVILVWRLRHTVMRWWRERREEMRESERSYFRQVEKAAESGDAKSTYNALMRWLDRAFSQEGDHPPLLQDFAELHGDESLNREIERLLRAIDKQGTEPWDGAALKQALRRARRASARTERTLKQRAAPLPALNPQTLRARPDG